MISFAILLFQKLYVNLQTCFKTIIQSCLTFIFIHLLSFVFIKSVLHIHLLLILHHFLLIIIIITTAQILSNINAHQSLFSALNNYPQQHFCINLFLISPLIHKVIL
jgi:hypothetical protein